MGVDEAGDDVAACRVEHFVAVVVADARDVAVDDRDVRLQPLAREGREHAPAANDELGGLVAAGHGEPSCEVWHGWNLLGRSRFAVVDVLTPRRLEEALALKAERPDAVPIQGGTDVMVELNFDRARPPALLNLNEVPELRGHSRENGTLRLGSGLTYTEAMGLAEPLLALAEASRTVGGPQIRNRGTIGGNLGTASPAGDALPPLLVYGAEVELASTRGSRTVPLREFLVGPKRNALEPDELIVAVRIPVPGPRQTFMKVGPRNAMVIAVVSLALVVDGDELRASYGSAGPVPGLVTAPVEERDTFPEQVAEAASPIDDVRGTARYRRHALRVLTERALERSLA